MLYWAGEQQNDGTINTSSPWILWYITTLQGLVVDIISEYFPITKAGAKYQPSKFSDCSRRGISIPEPSHLIVLAGPKAFIKGNCFYNYLMYIPDFSSGQVCTIRGFYHKCGLTSNCPHSTAYMKTATSSNTFDVAIGQQTATGQIGWSNWECHNLTRRWRMENITTE